jgi:hypothetical protein
LTTTVSTLGGAEAIDSDLLRELTPLFPLKVFESSLATFVLSAVLFSNVSATSEVSKGFISGISWTSLWSVGTLFIVEKTKLRDVFLQTLKLLR